MLRRWVRTVSTLTDSASAISAFERPGLQVLEHVGLARREQLGPERLGDGVAVPGAARGGRGTRGGWR